MFTSKTHPTWPNHALQRTAPGVTLAAADHPATFAHPAPSHLRPQPARRPPQSLSLGSLGVIARAHEADTSTSPKANAV